MPDCCAHFWSLWEGMGAAGGVAGDEGGRRRKGRAPVGEAWLLEETVRKVVLEKRR